MLKVIFAVLVLANAGVFAWQSGYLDSLIPSGREPARMANQLNADKLKLIPPPQPAQNEAEPEPEPAAAPPSAAPAAPPAPPAPQPEKAAQQPAPASDNTTRPPALVQTAERAPAPQTLACTEIGDFQAEPARRFGARMATLNLGNRLVRKPLQEASSWVVHMPPQPDKEAVERKAAELRNLGIEDFFVILDNSPLRWGISLGVFKQESAARAHLAALGEKGVRTARVTPRLHPNGLVAFQLQKLTPQEKAELDRIAAEFGGQNQRPCA